jgi:hypothetical protein
MNYPSPGKEILPKSFFSDIECNRLLESTDLTLIFNQHGNAEDAERSTDIIPPRSTVFIEGFTLDETAEGPGLLRSLNLTRLHYGLDSSEYMYAKQIVLETLMASAYTPPKSYTDFHDHSTREISLLVQKDCYVEYADYNVSELRSTSNDNPVVETIHRNLHKDSRVASYTPFIDSGLNHTTNHAKAIRDIEKATHAQNTKYYTREFAAFWSYFSNIYDISRAKHGDELAHGEDGRLKTFMVYGTAHKNSLTAQFESRNIKPSIRVLDSIHESDCIPANSPRYHDEIKRKIALSSFKSLAHHLKIDSTTTEQLAESLSEPFERLNQSQDDYQRILCELLDILNTEEKNKESNPDLAFEQLGKTYTRIIEDNL